MDTPAVIRHKRELMAQRDVAVKAKDWALMNRLTFDISQLGENPLTQREIERYARGKRRAS